MSAAYTEHTSLVSHHSPAELGDVEGILKGHFLRVLPVNVPKVNRLAAPFEVMHEFVGTVAFLEDERVVKQFSKLLHHIDLGVVRDPAR